MGMDMASAQSRGKLDVEMMKDRTLSYRDVLSIMDALYAQEVRLSFKDVSHMEIIQTPGWILGVMVGRNIAPFITLHLRLLARPLKHSKQDSQSVCNGTTQIGLANERFDTSCCRPQCTLSFRLRLLRVLSVS